MRAGFCCKEFPLSQLRLFIFFESIFGAIICQFKHFRLNQTLEHNYIFITRVKFILLKNETPFG